MEYTLFPNCSPIGSFNYQYYNSQGFDTPPRVSSSNSSMDTDMPIKFKDIQEDAFFSWPGEIRGSLDEERNAFPIHDSNQLCLIDHESAIKHELDRNALQHGHCDSCKNQEYKDVDDKIANYIPKPQKLIKFIQMEKEKEDRDQYGKAFVGAKATKARKLTNIEGKVDMDLYLDKAPIALSNLQEAGGSALLPRKRKLENNWQNNKVRSVNQQREMIGDGRLTSWAVEDLEIDLSGELSNASYNSMSEALLSLPTYKQEALSPTNGPRDPNSPPRNIPWMPRQQMMMTNNIGMNDNNPNCNIEQHSPSIAQVGNSGTTNQQVISQNQQNNQMVISSNGNAMGGISVVSYVNGMQETMNQTSSNPNQSVMDSNNGLLLCSSNMPMEAYANNPVKCMPQSMGNAFSQDNRFQYILAAPTSIATKCNEDTLTYLNQAQSYEIKFKKLGDLSLFRGKIFKSVIRICFYERRLQFAERDQMSQWQIERPGERIVEVDVPLSYGLIYVNQPTEQPLLNTVELYWDPVKEVGVYIKVNCISTEFTAKKHGGEKGVPFRIQVETFLPGDYPSMSGIIRSPNQPTSADKRLHAAACQIKVFKLKGADRKHKQDKEKIQRRPPSERDKYQSSYDCTIFVDLPHDAVFSPITVAGQSYSPDHCTGTGGVPPRPIPSSSNSPTRTEPLNVQTSAMQTVQSVKYEQRLSRTDSNDSTLDCEDDGLGTGMQCTPDSPLEADALTESSTAVETRAWLTSHRFLGSPQAFANFSGADLLRLTREDLIQICGMGDGIRLFNIIHPERTAPRLTIYLKKIGELQYNAVYLRTCEVAELRRKIQLILQDGMIGTVGDSTGIFVAGPNNITIRMTDEVVQNFKNDSMFRLEPMECGIILKPA